VLKKIVGNLTPRLIKTDFEQASIAAIRNSFPGVIVSGCKFHLNQALMRILKKMRLFNFYKTCATTKKFTKALTCLSYVVPEKN
jgi:hypothetical protein